MTGKPVPGSIRSEAKRRGMTEWQIRKERGWVPPSRRLTHYGRSDDRTRSEPPLKDGSPSNDIDTAEVSRKPTTRG